MFSFKGKKEDFQNKIRIQISTCRQQVKQKNDFLGKQINTLKSKYATCGTDFAKTFDIVVATNVYIKAANDLLSDLTILQQNIDLLFDKKTLPSQIQIALEKCYAIAKLNKQKDLLNLLNPIVSKHNCMTDIVASHESLVYLGTDLINEEDVRTYYPTIKTQCRFDENQYVRQSLAKYSFVFQPEIPNIQQFPFTPQTQPIYTSQDISPNIYAQNSTPQYGFQYFPQHNSTDLSPQYNSSNLPPQYNSGNLPPQYNSGNLPPQYNLGNLPPQYNSGNLPPQFNTGILPPQNIQFEQQPQTYSIPNQNIENIDESGLPSEMFVSVRPLSK